VGSRSRKPGRTDIRARSGGAALAGLAAGLTLLAAAGAAADPPAAYQVDPAHTGFAQSATLAPPLGKRWVRRDLGTGTSYPVIAEGKVFVAAAQTVYALDLATGATVWSRSLNSNGLAYDAGRVFAVDRSGVMQALAADTGALLWNAELPGSADPASPPVAYGEYVYASGSSTVFGVRQADGIVVFSQSAAASDSSIPAVDADKVYTTAGCAETSALERKVGAEIWRYTGDCTGGGGATAVVSGGRVYTRDGRDGVVLESTLGMLTDSFAAWLPPAITGDSGYYVRDKELFARAEPGGTVRWRYPVEAGVVLPPLVVGTFVYAVTGDAKLVAIARSSGAKAWEGELRPGGYYYSSSSGAWPGMAAGGGSLVVAWDGRVTAYSPGPDAPGVDDPDKPSGAGIALSIKLAPKRTAFGHPVLLTGTMRGSNGGLSGPVEIQADPWPYGSWEHLKTVHSDYGDFTTKVRPDRNTRYRAVHTGTNPALQSATREVFSDFFEHFTVRALSTQSVRIRIRVAGPPDLRLAGRRIYVYHFHRRAPFSRRIGVLRLRRHGSGARAAGRLHTPRLRRDDLFFTCIRERHDDGFGRWDTSLRRCGRRRL
jgi:outer membrane protein assembly factor BamB